MGKRPQVEIEWETTYLETDSEFSYPLIRLSNNAYKRIGARCGEWLKIEAKSSGKVIYRIGRGCPNRVSGLKSNMAMLDANGAFELGVMSLLGEDGTRPRIENAIKVEGEDEDWDVYSADWVISKASFIGRIKAQLRHPDRGYRASMQIAFISLAVGILGFLMGLIGLFF